MTESSKKETVRLLLQHVAAAAAAAGSAAAGAKGKLSLEGAATPDVTFAGVPLFKAPAS